MRISMPSIEQFRHVIRAVSLRSSYIGKDASGEAVYDGTLPKPTLKYRGLAKVHGTNCSVVREPDGTLLAQGRTRILTVEKDNFGFAWFVHNVVPREVWEHLFAPLVSRANGRSVALFAEWSGKGIQKGVAVGEVDKFMAIFGACAKGPEDGDSREWFNMAEFDRLPASPEHRIYNLLQPEFKPLETKINFNKPELAQNFLVEATNEVERECPIGKFFGISGIGEGRVWSCVTPGWTDPGYWMKVKGTAHSVSRVKTLAEVDVEKVASLYEFADKVCTRPRLEQGIQWLQENGNEKRLTQRSTGEFIRWVVGDIVKEESDTMVVSNLTPTEVGKACGKHAQKFFFTWLNEQAGVPPSTETT